MISCFEINKCYKINTTELPFYLSCNEHLDFFSKQGTKLKCDRIKNDETFCFVRFENSKRYYAIPYIDFKYFDYHNEKSNQEEMEL